MEKKTLVLDASVIVKWFSEEEHTKNALKIRDRFFGGELGVLVPELMFYEVSNAIRYNKVFSKEDKRKVVQDLFSIDFDLVPCNQEILSQALELALKTDTTIYDNLYLSVGRSKECPLITADKTYVNKVAAEDVIFIGSWR